MLCSHNKHIPISSAKWNALSQTHTGGYVVNFVTTQCSIPVVSFQDSPPFKPNLFTYFFQRIQGQPLTTSHHATLTETDSGAGRHAYYCQEGGDGKRGRGALAVVPLSLANVCRFTHVQSCSIRTTVKNWRLIEMSSQLQSEFIWVQMVAMVLPFTALVQ